MKYLYLPYSSHHNEDVLLRVLDFFLKDFIRKKMLVL